jgi:hypothetical protein
MKSKLHAIAALLALAASNAVLAAEPPKLAITHLEAASGKTYTLGQFAKGAKQYIDRDYQFEFVPGFLAGQTTILTAGNDKHIDQAQKCLSFEVNRPVTVYIVYGDKLRVLPAWLRSWDNTRWKVTRTDSSAVTLKGLFSLFAKDFPAGRIVLNGNLSPEMAADPEFRKNRGGTFCMYSVVVAPRNN